MPIIISIVTWNRAPILERTLEAILDILPCSTSNNLPNSALVNSVLVRQASFRNASTDKCFTDCFHLIWQQLRAKGNQSPFLGGILRILFACTKKKVIRVDAATITSIANWVVFVTAVAYEQILWNGAVMQYPRNTVGRYILHLLTIAKSQPAIPIRAYWALPNPTIVGLKNTGPKAISQRNTAPEFIVTFGVTKLVWPWPIVGNKWCAAARANCDRIFVHRKLLSSGAIGQAVTAALPYFRAHYSTSSAN